VGPTVTVVYVVDVVQMEPELVAAAMDEDIAGVDEASTEEAGAEDVAAALEVGTAMVIGTPTLEQMPSRTETTAAWSEAAGQAAWTQGSRVAVSSADLSQEQVKSVALQPMPETPVTMQSREHDGRSAMLWD